MASKLFNTFIFLLVSISDASLTPISSAWEVLSDSSYFSMGLTLQLASKDLSLEDWQELTIFAPYDSAFSKSGQPSLLDIKYHLSPARLPEETLRNLPPGAKIPTLRSNSSLTVTSSSRSGGKFSINDVIVQDSPVYDDGFVVIYGSDEFFTIPNPNSIHIPSSGTRASPIPNFSDSSKNPKPVKNRFNIFESASSFLISRGFVIMATFLALQLESSESNETKITVFAPIDEAIPNSTTTRFSDYVTVFRGHVIQRLLSLKDLQKLAWEGSSILQTVLKGYEIEVSWSGDNTLLLNGVTLIYPDLYVNDWIVVHGINKMIVTQTREEEEEDYVHGEYSTELGDYGLH